MTVSHMLVRDRTNTQLWAEYLEYRLPFVATPDGYTVWLGKIKVPYATEVHRLYDDTDIEIVFKDEKDLTFFLLTL